MNVNWKEGIICKVLVLEIKKTLKEALKRIATCNKAAFCYAFTWNTSKNVRKVV